MAVKRDYLLPDGQVTQSRKVYYDLWADFAKPIEKATGWEATGFDPGLLFRDPETGVSVDISSSRFIRLLNIALMKEQA